jgi:hypothetical protein
MSQYTEYRIGKIQCILLVISNNSTTGIPPLLTSTNIMVVT